MAWRPACRVLRPENLPQPVALAGPWICLCCRLPLQWPRHLDRTESRASPRSSPGSAPFLESRKGESAMDWLLNLHWIVLMTLIVGFFAAFGLMGLSWTRRFVMPGLG